MLLLILSFVAGVLTVLAPCTLPLLPVIIGGSVTGKPSLGRAAVVILSLGVSLFIFTLILKVSTAFIAVPPVVWQILSGGLIIIFGVITVFPGLWDSLPFVNKMNTSSNRLLGTGFKQKNLWGDIIIGASLGPIFSSCSPTYFLILATVLPANLVLGLAYLLIYIAGLCLALLLITVVGQRIVDKLGVASDSRGWFKRTLGALFILIGIAVLFGFDKTLESTVSAHSGSFDVTKVEEKLLHSGPPMQSTTAASMTSTSSLAALTLGNQSGTQSASPTLTPAEKAGIYPKAPELATADAYLNTGGKAISLAQYRGKNVVLIDFWTYSCINCQRTLPYLTSWYQKYKDQGLVVIGIHTPEFAFEHVQANVQDALKRFGITYPVLLDNEYQTWNTFGNEYWPQEYLVDIDGYIVHSHSGEGEYDVTEKAIQAALAERAARLGTSMVATSTASIAPANLSGIGSPETYFGSGRNEYLGNGTQATDGSQTLTIPSTINANTLYLGGTWNFSKEYAAAASGDTVTYRYTAKDVYVVASADAAATMTISQDGASLGSAAGADVVKDVCTIGQSRLYHIVHNASAGEHTLTLTVHGPIQFYTFTFG